MREIIGKAVFGTSDVDGVLDVLSPSDALVKEFHRRMASVSQKVDQTKGDVLCQTQRTELPKH